MNRLWHVAPYLVMGGALFLSSIADACRCLEVNSASAAYKHAHAVVTGRVESITQHSDDVDGSDVSFKVTQSWKMQVPARIRITTGTTCAFSFAPDGSYLLFLQQASGDSYTTARCMGNRELATADSFLKWLRENAKRGAAPDASKEHAK
jgi:hypothetical protein